MTNDAGFSLMSSTQRSLYDPFSGASTTEKNGDDEGRSILNLVVGGALGVLLVIFAITFFICWVRHKRLQGQRLRRQRRLQELLASCSGSNQESSRVVVDDLSGPDSRAPPPPYHGIINQGLVEEPPPSYDESLTMTIIPSNKPSPLPQSSPPSYSASIQRENEASSRNRNTEVETVTNHPPDVSLSMRTVSETPEQPSTDSDLDQNTDQATDLEVISHR